MEPEGSMPHSKGSQIIPILSQINPIPHIDTYFYKFHSNIVLLFVPRPSKGLFPVGLPIKILEGLLPLSILASCSVNLNFLDLLTLIWILIGKLTGTRPSRRSRHRWEDSIRMDLKEIGNNTTNWFESAKDRDYWRALVNAALILRVPWAMTLVNYIIWTVQTMKFIILKSSPLPILINFWHKYSTQDLVLKYP